MKEGMRLIGLDASKRLSLARILLIPVILYLISMQNEQLRFVSCVLFVIAGITDGLDGLIARRMGTKRASASTWTR